MNYKYFDKEYFQEEYEDLFSYKQDMINVAQEDGSRLYYLFKNSVRWLTLKIANGEHDISELTDYFRYANQGIVAHFKTMEGKGKPVKVLVADKEVELTNEGTSYYDVIYAGAGISAALVSRNKEALDYLFNIPDKIIFRADPAKSTDASKIFLFRKKIYENKKIDKSEFQAIHHSSEKNSFDKPEFYHLIQSPLYKLMEALASDDKANFNTILSEALIKFQEYYDTTKESRHQLIEGWLPIYIIALACLAYDRGFLIEVDSPLLPMFLVKGECKVPTLKG
jgi:hypothetical protein